MNKIKIGDKVRRIGETFGSMLQGGIYTVLEVDHQDKVIVLKELDQYTYDLNCFELVQDITIPNKPFGQLKLKEKLSIIEAFLRNQRLEVSMNGQHWSNHILNTDSKIMNWDDSLYYRVKDTAETQLKIEDIQFKMKELSSELDKLKAGL
jgi:hypothetical protein